MYHYVPDLCSKGGDTVIIDTKSSDAFCDRWRESLRCCKVKPEDEIYFENNRKHLNICYNQICEE